jgi:signal transduction histidine kinase
VHTVPLADERARLAALRRFNILDTPREQPFDDIVEIAAQVTDMPIALINLVDEDRQWGKALVGLESSEAPRDASFCAVTIETGDDVMVVNDTHSDERFAGNPQVLGFPFLRFYAGAPIVDRNGLKLGTVCVADSVPRTLDDGQLGALQALARQAMAQMELRLALDAEREQVRRLQELDRARDLFVSTVSHELRTPLTSIRGWVEILVDDGAGLTPGQRQSLERVDRNARRLERLVEDLLDLTRSDVGVLTIRSDTVDLAGLVRDAVAAMTTAAAATEIEVSASIPATLPIAGDGERLAQVVDNLCSNAVKYTPAGGRIAVSLEARDASAVLRVCDSGIGIPAAEREFLFQRFFRASTATTNHIPGTGLGLAISKAIAEHHGGTIEVGDGDEGGSAFTFTLPVG